MRPDWFAALVNPWDDLGLVAAIDMSKPVPQKNEGRRVEDIELAGSIGVPPPNTPDRPLVCAVSASAEQSHRQAGGSGVEIGGSDASFYVD